MNDSGYLCKECGLPVVVINEELVRKCEHTNAPVIAVMSGTVTGESKVD